MAKEFSDVLAEAGKQDPKQVFNYILQDVYNGNGPKNPDDLESLYNFLKAHINCSGMHNLLSKGELLASFVSDPSRRKAFGNLWVSTFLEENRQCTDSTEQAQRDALMVELAARKHEASWLDKRDSQIEIYKLKEHLLKDSWVTSQADTPAPGKSYVGAFLTKLRMAARRNPNVQFAYNEFLSDFEERGLVKGVKKSDYFQLPKEDVWLEKRKGLALSR